MAVVWITGASSGLGEHLALEMASRGHDLGLMARRVQQLEDLKARIEAHGVRCEIAPCDVTDFEAHKAAAETLDSLGPVDIIVANAGIEGKFDVTDVDLKEVRRTFDVNVMGAIHTATLGLERMVPRNRGQLVVVSSVASNRGLPKSGPYSASKAAITTFWESMRVDLAKTGIRTTTIHPGFVDTAMTQANDFPMPFMITPQDAARRMADAIATEKRMLTYPWQMWVLERVMRTVPHWLYDAIITRADVRT